MLRTFFALLLLMFLSGCFAVDIKTYEGTKPQLSLFDYFQGNSKGWGIVQNRKGELTRQFVVDIKGYLNEQGEIVLEEDFFWRNGEKSTRTWIINRLDNKKYTGRAADVVDVAQGSSSGSVLNWQYTLNLDVDGSTWEINFDDWMFLQQDNVLINKAKMEKFGFRVGEVTIVFMKIPDNEESK